MSTCTCRCGASTCASASTCCGSRARVILRPEVKYVLSRIELRLAQRALCSISGKVIIANGTWPAMAIVILAVMLDNARQPVAVP